MSDTQKEIKYDLDGFDSITAALRSLVNQYPALPDGDEITFAVLSEDGGKAIIPLSDSVIVTETEDITGHVTQECSYTFAVVYRGAGLSENRKAAVKEWLDDLGRWLERQEILVNDVGYRLEEYPTIGSRYITKINRISQANLDSVEENKSENWAISINARYINEFDN